MVKIFESIITLVCNVSQIQYPKERQKIRLKLNKLAKVIWKANIMIQL